MKILIMCEGPNELKIVHFAQTVFYFASRLLPKLRPSMADEIARSFSYIPPDFLHRKGR